MNDDQLGTRILAGDIRALSRSISLVENNSSKSGKIVSEIFSHIGKSHIIGMTGPPGSGKSTIINRLIEKYREKDLSIAVLAIDPTSPFTGGAILGDRIRMLDFSSDPKVYIRSMASRGRIGGLSSSTFDTICLLDAYGFDKIIVETVGAGQNEVDIYQYCDSTIVVTVPGLGDDIQSIKAGIYEIPDLFTVNKGDLKGSDELKIQLQIMLDTQNPDPSWRIPVLKISAISGFGFEDLLEKIESHLQYLQNSNLLKERRQERVKTDVMYKLRNLLLKQFESENISIETEIARLMGNNLPPFKIAQDLLEKLK